MQGRVVEHVVRPKLLGPKLRLRVDLHGVSVFGPGNEHTLIRWEWLTEILENKGVTIRSGALEVHFPAGAFGREPAELLLLLNRARSISDRANVIGELTNQRS